jgi:NAD(P)-dependent dehydrogenase (short-subunit alcohol dehydrogenase family)
MSLFDLDGRVAIVTGSSRGIGRAIAERLAEHGARVVVSSRQREACEIVVAAINGKHGAGTALAIPANISAKEELRALIERTRESLGPVSVLVCNAASNPYYGPLAAIGDEQFRKILDNNVLSNHWLIQLAAPHMVARHDGAIIIISSVAGLRAMEGIGAYGVSKAADMQLVRSYALEYGPHNVRVNCIAPGLIKTDFARALWEDPAALARHTQSSPLRRIGEPDDVAGAAVFLASQAGRFVTGQTIVVDGGDTIR